MVSRCRTRRGHLGGLRGDGFRLRLITGDEEDRPMKFGASMFFTDYSMGAAELAVALEERGFDIFWAPEHSHIPIRASRGLFWGASCPSATTTLWTRL